MKVACLQFTPRFGAVAENRARLVSQIRGCDAELLVLPELALSGYQIRDRTEALELSEPAEGPTAAAFAAACRPGQHVVAGFVEREGEQVYNAALVVGAGGLVGCYRKVHLFGHEPDWSAPGDRGFAVFELGGLRLGVMICFDWLFPEAARSLALAGADLIAHPANLVLPWCQRSMPLRALENGIYTATANRCGAESRLAPPLRFTGGSLLVAPDGRVLARAPHGQDAVITAEIDPARARDKWLTATNHRLSDRRPGQYR